MLSDKGITKIFIKIYTIVGRIKILLLLKIADLTIDTLFTVLYC